LSGHINIVQFVAAASIGKEESGHGQAEFLILTELCTGFCHVFYIYIKPNVCVICSFENRVLVLCIS